MERVLHDGDDESCARILARAGDDARRATASC